MSNKVVLGLPVTDNVFSKEEVPDVTFLEEDASDPQSGGALDEVMFHVNTLRDLDAKIEVISGQLDALQHQRDQLVKEVLPGILDANGLDELKLSNGLKVTVKEDVYARIPVDSVKRQVAFEWLRKNGAESKIQDQYEITNPGKSVAAQLDKLGIAYDHKESVNTNSLTSFFREVLGLKKGAIAQMDIDDIPKEFGVFLTKEAKIK